MEIRGEEVLGTYFSASLGSTMAGWHSAPILKGFSGVLAVKEITLEPQQNCRRGGKRIVQSASCFRVNKLIRAEQYSHQQRPIP